MKRMAKLVTGNFGLKLLALVLAIVVYFSMRDSLRAERQGKRPAAEIMKGAVP